MADSELGGLARKIDRLADDLTGRAMREALNKVGQAAKDDVAEAVRRDLGDLSMSNWRRGRPIQLVARYDMVGDTGLAVTPAKRARGPMRVLQEGRRAGVSKGRRGRAPRRYGSSAGKGTWTNATRLVERRTTGRVAPEVRKAIARQFKG